MRSIFVLPVLFAIARLCLAQDLVAQRRDDPNQALRIPVTLGEGIQIARVYIYVVDAAGRESTDAALKETIESAFAVRSGAEFKQVFAENGAQNVRKIPGVATAEFRLYQWDSPGALQVALIVNLDGPRSPKSGLLQSGNGKDFPRLFFGSKGLLKVIFQPSLGFFNEQNVWLGNSESFTSGSKPKTVAWPEMAQELGIGGIVQLGNKPAYAYGATTYEWGTTLSQDTFQRSRIAHGELELGYGGVLFAKPGSKTSFDFSAGRQSFSLNSNFLFGFVLGSTNGAYRGNSGLSPRQAFRMTALGRFHHGPLTVQGFYLEPNRLNLPGQVNRFAGVNLRYNDNKKIDASFLYATSFRSDLNYQAPTQTGLSREGLRAFNPRLRWIAPAGINGFWVEGEYAFQNHSRFPMAAHGYGAWAGYTFLEKLWRPGIRYRYAYFSGDNPNTKTYERFDPLLGGVQGNWVQGLTMVKLYNNANVRSHRVEVSVKPRANIEFLVDYHRLFADQLNNLGGKPPLANLQSKDIGHSIAPTLRWFLSKGLYMQALVDMVVPGEAFRRALPRPPSTWASYQLALYFGL